MPRKPDTPEARTQKLLRSFSREIGYFESAQAAKGTALAADCGSAGAAINLVQKLHRCRTFLREQRIKEGGESYENVVVRRIGAAIVLQWQSPVTFVPLTEEQASAILTPLPPMTFVLPQAATPTVPAAKEPTDEEVLGMLRRVEHMLGNLNDEAIVLGLFDGDKDKMKVALDRLFEAGQLEFDDEGHIQTKGRQKAPLAAE